MTGYSLNSIVAKYPIYRDWKDVPEFIRPGKWVQAKEDWDSKYQIYKPFQVDEQDPIEYAEGVMIRSNPDYGIFINCAHIEAADPPVDSKEGMAARIAAAVAALSTPDVSDAVKWTREGEVPTAHEIDMGIAITKALNILEGREALNDA